MFFTLFILSLVLLAIGFIGFSISLLVKSKGKFPDISIGKNKEMRKRNINCPRCSEITRCKLKNQVQD